MWVHEKRGILSTSDQCAHNIQTSLMARADVQQWHHVLHIILNNDSSQWTDSTETQRRKEPGDRVHSVAWEETRVRFLSTARNLPSVKGPETPLHRAQTHVFITFCQFMSVCSQVLLGHSQWKKKIYHPRFHSQCGKEPRHTALFRIVTRNMWQFLKSDSILSMDSILK